MEKVDIKAKFIAFIVCMLVIATAFSVVISIKNVNAVKSLNNNDLADALDNYDIEWTSNGFYYQENVYFYDHDAAQCDSPGGNLHGEIHQDKGTLRFYCNVEDADDWAVNFWIRYKNGDTIQDSAELITPDRCKDEEGGWYKYEYTLDEIASYEFIWMFSRSSGEPYVDSEIHAWVDKVEWKSDLYTLTVNIEGNGSVARQPDKEKYMSGEVVELFANPDEDWEFDHWSGDLTGDSYHESITMDSNKTVTANFKPDEYDYITFHLEAKGWDGSNPPARIRIDPNGEYVENFDENVVVSVSHKTDVTLTTEVDQGWTLSNFSVYDYDGDQNDDEGENIVKHRQITLTIDNDYEANFSFCKAPGDYSPPDETTFQGVSVEKLGDDVAVKFENVYHFEGTTFFEIYAEIEWEDGIVNRVPEEPYSYDSELNKEVSRPLSDFEKGDHIITVRITDEYEYSVEKSFKFTKNKLADNKEKTIDFPIHLFYRYPLLRLIQQLYLKFFYPDI